jgi:CubicO group peptidase (beta-lactamase class C family)
MDRSTSTHRVRVRPVLALLFLVLTLSACELLGDVLDTIQPVAWNSRFAPAEELAWGSNRDLTRTQFDDRLAVYTGRGYMVVDVDVRSEGLGLRYALIAHENPDDRDWALHVDLTSDEYHALWTDYRDRGYRPLDVEGYLVDGQTRFAGIWIENVEDLAWSSIRNMTSAEYAEYFDARSAEGLRPIDIEAYDTPSGLRFAAIWWENVDGLAWSQLRNIDRTRYEQEVDDLAAAGYFMIDYETYDTADGRRYAAIWERRANRPAYQIRTNRNELGFANLWRTYRDQGYRIADFEGDEASTDLYAGIWIENDDRFRFPLKGALDTAITNYLATYTDTSNAPESQTGISVVVIQDGDVVYRRGFGMADVAGGKVAHAATVYGLASVSKVIGGTLAALLEAEQTLRDGTTFTLDMDDPTSDYLADLPDHHTHTVEQLTAHLGCVPHYPRTMTATGWTGTVPGISNLTTHFDTALDAAEAIWDTGLVTTTAAGGGCTVGATRSYSTPAFTLLGAVLEQATGRTIVELLQDEVFAPQGLSSMRVQYASGSQIADYERAVHYDQNSDPAAVTGCATGEACDNTWKVLGGGIESNALDLADFGWRVLDGRVVDAATRDGRLWTPVDEDCTLPGGGVCRNGVGWELRTVGAGSQRVAEHGGSQAGARSHLRVYRDDGLVIAILTNEGGHTPSGLATTIGDAILGP